MDGKPTPVYRLLGALLPSRGGHAFVASRRTIPLRVAALFIGDGIQERLLLDNATEDAVRLRLPFTGDPRVFAGSATLAQLGDQTVMLPPANVVHLDQ
jgi:hypothetical protein